MITSRIKVLWLSVTGFYLVNGSLPLLCSPCFSLHGTPRTLSVSSDSYDNVAVIVACYRKQIGIRLSDKILFKYIRHKVIQLREKYIQFKEHIEKLIITLDKNIHLFLRQG